MIRFKQFKKNQSGTFGAIWIKLFILLLATPLSIISHTSSANAVCEVIPGVQMLFGGVEGNANQPFAAPGEIVELTPPVGPVQGGDFAEGATGGDHVITLAITPYPNTSTTELVTIQASCPSSKLSVCSGKTVTCIERGGGDTLALSISASDNGNNRALLFQWPEEDELPNPVGPARIAVRDLTTGTSGVECSLGDAPGGSYDSICEEIASGSEPPIVCVDRLLDPVADPSEAYSIFPTFVALPEALDFRESCFSGEVCDPLETEIRMAADENGNLLLPVDWIGVLQQTSSLPIPRLVSGRVRAPFPVNLPSDVFVSSWTPSGRQLPPVFEPTIASASTGDVFELFGTADATASVLRLARRHGTCDGGANAGELCEFGGSAGDCPAGNCMESCINAPATNCSSDAECGSGPEDICGSNYDPALPVAAGVVGLQREVGSPGGSMRRRTSRAANSSAGFCQAEIDEVGCDETADCPAGIGEDLCVRWAMEANELVDFAGALESDSARTFIVREGVNLVDLNGDGDTIDPIIVFRDRGTGLSQPLGISATCSGDGNFDATAEGRAITMVRRGGYRSPAVALDGDRMAFLQDEEKTDAAGSGFPSQQYCDLNGDLDGMDSVLRVFEIGGTAQGGAVSIAGLSSRAVDPAPVIDGQSIAFRGDLLFFRTIESGSAGFAKDTANAVPPLPAPQLPPFLGTPRDAAISGDGTTFAWIASHPSGLGSPYGDYTHVIFRQGLTGSLEILSYDGGSGDPADGNAESPALNNDGSVRAFASDSTELLPGATTITSRIFVHTTANGLEFIDAGRAPKLSDDGRYVAYLQGSQAIVYDRTLDQTHWQSESLGLTTVIEIAIAGNGQFVALVEQASPGEGIFWDRVRVHDIAANMTMTATNNVDGEAGNGPASSVSISADGRRVAFRIEASNMDSAGVPGVFATDTQTGTTQRASVIDATAVPMPPPTLNPVISADGRMVVFGAFDSAIPGQDRAVDDGGGIGEWIRHDLETGQTRSLAWAGDALTDPGRRPALTADGRTLLYPNGPELRLRGTGAFDPIFDIDNDGTSGTVLEVVDLGVGAPEVTPICAATAVAPFSGGAAFLRPENTGLAGICPGGGDLNTDGDTDDAVTYLWNAVGAVQNLGVAATRILATDSMVAALVSEQGDGTDYDGDTLLESQVLMLRASDGSGAWWNSGRDTIEVAVAGNFAGFTSRVGGTNVVASANFGAGSPGVTENMEGFAGTDLVLGERSICPNGIWVQPLAFRVPESEMENDLNSDGDQSDEVLVVWDLESGALISSGQSARPCPEAACDPRFPHRVEGTSVRFITLETDEAGAGTNGGTDIDGDCRDNGLVVQVLDLCAALQGGGGGSLINAEPATLGTSTGNALVDPLVEIDESFVRSISAGRCVILDNTESPIVCTEDGNECDALGPRSRCDVATATCVLRVPAGCVPPDPNEPGQSDRCPAETVCETGVCAPLTVPCTDNGDCTAVAPATCQSGICTTSTTTCDDDGDCDGTEACFGIEVDSSGIAVAGSGICGPSLKSCSEDAECATGTTCIAGACVSDPTVLCAGSGDCSGNQFCRAGTSVTAVRPQIQDRDGDGVPDDTDNCPDLFDPWQESGDCDGDCIPNRCDDDPCPTPQPTPTPTPSPTPSPVCGNGTIESGEQCDDGAANGGGTTCCDTDCSYKADGPASCDGEACTNDTCTAGVCESICRTGEACSVCGGTCSSASGCGCLF